MTDGGPDVVAGGGVVHRLNGSGKRQVLLVHRKRYDDWTLPKGKVERGETIREAARREVAEETGYECAAGRDRLLGTVGYPVGRGHKIVRYWLMEPERGSFRPNAEVDDVAWLSLPKATKLLSYEIDMNVLDWAARQLADRKAGRLYLIRHAYAGRRSAWKGDDFARPLTRRGAVQAAHLAETLRTHPLDRVLSSPYVRCVETVEPLAERLHLKLRTDDRFAEDEASEHAAELLREATGRSLVLCGHRDGLAAIIKRARRDRAELDGPATTDKGSTWVLDTRDGVVQSGVYRPGAPTR